MSLASRPPSAPHSPLPSPPRAPNSPGRRASSGPADRATVLAGQLAALLFVAIALSPAFFAVVVWDRSGDGTLPATAWGQARAEMSTALWRLHAGQLYGSAVVLLASAVVLVALTGNRGRRGDTPLIAAFLALYAAPVVSGVLGEHGGADNWRLWLPPLVLLAFYLAPSTGLTVLLGRARLVLRCYTWGSLAALLAVPDWAITASRNANFSLEEFTPGGRLSGLATHPVMLGVMVAMALVLECVPLVRTRWWALHGTVAAVTLLLAQSRTAWIMTLVGLLFLYRREVAHRVHPVFVRLMAAGTAACGLLLVPGVPEQLVRLSQDQEMTTLHGRNLTWQAVFEAFHTNVWLGYGPALFDDPLSPVHLAYDHAHNQLLHTLGIAGLLGAVVLAVLLAVVVVTAVRVAPAGAGLSLCLAGLLLVACVPDVPLRGAGFSPYLLLNVLVFTVLRESGAGNAAGAGSREEPAPEGARSGRGGAGAERPGQVRSATR
ncbi:O-antigen ligase family protein [Streptomyces sp. NPDC087440]|uniref:O-antigen ligase family protein n=1 Tax=Streptomyces sp. NPDC087440 TaxID=3365790 RepID=UPI00381A12C4